MNKSSELCFTGTVWGESTGDQWKPHTNCQQISMVSCQKGPTCHACAWQIGPFWQDTLVIWKSFPCYDIISWPGRWCMSHQHLSSKTVMLSTLTTHFTLHTYSKSYVWYLDMTGQDWVWIKYTLPSTPFCTTDVASKGPWFHPSTPCDSWQDVLRQDTSHRRPHEICTVFYSSDQFFSCGVIVVYFIVESCDAL